MAAKKGSERKTGFTIVVGVDYTSAGDAALAEAITQSTSRDEVTLHVVHAVAPPLQAGKTAAGIHKVEALLEKAGAKLKTYVDKARLSPALKGRDLLAHVRIAAPDEAIVQLAVDVDADLVVVGTTPRKGIAKLVHSSVSAKVLKQAECAVLLVRKKNHSGMAKTPRIEPACAKCQAVRTISGGTAWWCERHEDRQAHALHVYSYKRELALRSVVPVGGT
jgi:nucleotide-binding universal stress UspA family protein